MDGSVQHATLGIRGRLFIGFSLLIIPILILTTLFLLKINRIEAFTENLADVIVPTEALTANLDAQIYETQLIGYELVFLGDVASKSNFIKSWDQIKLVQKEMQKYAPSWINKDFIDRWETLKGLYSSLELVQNKIMGLEPLNKTEQVKTIIQNEQRPLVAKMLELISGSLSSSGKREGGMFDTQGAELSQGAKDILDDVNSLRLMAYGLLLVTIILSLFVSLGLAKISKRITEASQNMSITLDEVKQASDMQSTGVSEQASSINEITASLEEIDKSASQTMEKAKVLGEIAEKTAAKGQVGMDAVEQSVKGMKSIRDKVEIIAKTILELSNQTQQVGEITTVVNTIALQSKMLALNASIEAAKAGEAGKGFAVVASEVKNLAEQSEQATTQVQKILEDIRHGTEQAVLVTEEGTKGVDEGTGLVEQMGEIVHSLTEAINETMVACQQIEAAVRQESLGIEQITVGMNEINQVTSSFVNTVKQTNESVIKLDEMANSIKIYTQGLNRG